MPEVRATEGHGFHVRVHCRCQAKRPLIAGLSPLAMGSPVSPGCILQHVAAFKMEDLNEIQDLKFRSLACDSPADFALAALEPS